MDLVRGLIVENDLLTATLLDKVFSATSGMQVTTAQSAAAASRAIQELAFDFALLDLNLGAGPGGIDIAHALRSKNPTIGLVLLTSYPDLRFHSPSHLIPRGMRILTKGNPRHLDTLVQTCLHAARLPLEEVKTTSPFKELSGSDFETWRLVALGFTNAEMAQHFGIGEKAVEKRMQKLCKTLGLNSSSGRSPRIELIRTYASISGQLPIN